LITITNPSHSQVTQLTQLTQLTQCYAHKKAARLKRAAFFGIVF